MADFAQVEPEKVEQTIEKINTALQGKEVSKKVKQKLNYAKKHWPDKLREYKEKEEILTGRNSYSKTDTDATFIRMKDDHMQNGQLKPGYNLQISTNKQFITHYSIHQKPTDTNTLVPHFKEFKKRYKRLPKAITADAGYGSQQNYEYLEKEQVEAYVKYPYFHKEQKEKKKQQDKLKDIKGLHYNPEKIMKPLFADFFTLILKRQ